MPKKMDKQILIWYLIQVFILYFPIAGFIWMVHGHIVDAIEDFLLFPIAASLGQIVWMEMFEGYGKKKIEKWRSSIWTMILVVLGILIIGCHSLYTML